MIRRCALRNTPSSTGAMLRSCGAKPGTSALVESTMNRSTPSAPSRAKAAQVGEATVERQLVHLEVAGVQDQCRPRCGSRPRARPGSSG